MFCKAKDIEERLFLLEVKLDRLMKSISIIANGITAISLGVSKVLELVSPTTKEKIPPRNQFN
jgi:hypothetical protein